MFHGDTFSHILSFLNGVDHLSTDCVCQKWRFSITNPVQNELVWFSRAKMDTILQHIVSSLSCVPSWKAMFVQHKRRTSTFAQSYLEVERKIDWHCAHHDIYHDIWESMQLPEDTLKITFIVHIWTTTNVLIRRTAPLAISHGNIFEIGLDDLSLASLDTFEAIEVFQVMDEGHVTKIYSGRSHGQPCDGAFTCYTSFEKFSGMHLLIKAANTAGPSTDYLSYPMVELSVTQSVTTTATMLTLALLWNVTGKAHDNHMVPMSNHEAILFCEKGLTLSSPSTPLFSEAPTPPPEQATYTPRCLESYGFLVDLFIKDQSCDKVVSSITSQYYDKASFEGEMLSFTLPEHCHEHLPTHPFDFDAPQTTMVVHVIDKFTGKQAKLFQGGACGHGSNESYDDPLEREYFSFGEYPYFTKFTALSYLSARDHNDFLAYPMIDALVYNDASPCFELTFYWNYNDLDGCSTGCPSDCNTFLTFLDKCLDFTE